MLFNGVYMLFRRFFFTDKEPMFTTDPSTFK